MPDDYAPSDDFGNEAWLYGNSVPGLFSQPTTLQDAFVLNGTGPGAPAPLLGPFASFAPEDFLLDPSLSPSEAATGNNLGMPSSPTQVGRYHCPRPGCSNNNGEGFQRPSDLRRHQEKHEKRHRCSDCSWQFGSKADLERHGREVHGKSAENGKPSMHFCPEKSCKRCKRGFPRLWNMQQHYNKMHGGPLPSPSSSPATYSVDTPLISSSGESAPTTPPTSMDEPHTPCPPAVEGQGNRVMRDLILSRLKALETQRQKSDDEANTLRRCLRQMDLESNE